MTRTGAFTFVRREGNAFAPCHDCRVSLSQAALHFWNWRPQAHVKFLCDACFTKRSDARDERRAKYGIEQKPAPSELDQPLWRLAPGARR